MLWVVVEVSFDAVVVGDVRVVSTLCSSFLVRSRFTVGWLDPTQHNVPPSFVRASERYCNAVNMVGKSRLLSSSQQRFVIIK